MYVFHLRNFTKLFSFLAIFFNLSTLSQRCCKGDMTSWRQTMSNQRWNNLSMSKLKFTMLSNVESTLFISTLILTTLDNVESVLLFSTSNFITLINVKTALWIWPFSKSWKEQKAIFKLQKKDDSFD